MILEYPATYRSRVFNNSAVLISHFSFHCLHNFNYTDSRRLSVPPGAIAKYPPTKKLYVCDTKRFHFFPLNFVDPVNGFNYPTLGLNHPQRRLLYSPKRLTFSFIGFLFSLSC